MADVLFTSFQFAAQGAPTARTMPVRLAEIKNVKDFGAVGAGGVDDTAAIQAAVNWTSGPDRGTIFFPAGFYSIHAPITFNYDPAPGDPGLNIRFVGEADSTAIAATSFPGGTGYALDRHLATPNNTASVTIENINIQAVGNEGSIRVGSCNSVTIRNVHCGLITTEDSPGNSSQGILIETCTIPGGGLVMGGSGLVENVNFTSCDIAARLYGKGWTFQSNRCEECNTSYLIGLDSGVAATFTASIAYTVLATFTGTLSGNTMTVSGVTGSIAIGQTIHGVGISAYQITGGSGSSWTFNGPTQSIGPISMATDDPNDINGGVLTVTAVASGTIKPLQAVQDGGVNVGDAIFIVEQLTSTAGGGALGSTGTYRISNTPSRYHSVVYAVSSQTITTIGNDAGASGFAIQTGSQEGNINGVIFAGTCDGFFCGSLSSDGHSNSGTQAGGFILPTQYNLIVGPNCSNGVFQSTYTGGDLTMIAVCKVYAAASRANLVFIGCQSDAHAAAGGTGLNWDFPANAYTAQFLNCNESPVWTYSQLPQGSDALEGDQFTITDGSTATWGATCTGSGGNRVLVRYNGSAYTVVGK